MPQPIEFYYDFSSPYAYLASHGIDAIGVEQQSVAVRETRLAPDGRRAVTNAARGRDYRTEPTFKPSSTASSAVRGLRQSPIT